MILASSLWLSGFCAISFDPALLLLLLLLLLVLLPTLA